MVLYESDDIYRSCSWYYMNQMIYIEAVSWYYMNQMIYIDAVHGII